MFITNFIDDYNDTLSISKVQTIVQTMIIILR